MEFMKRLQTIYQQKREPLEQLKIQYLLPLGLSYLNQSSKTSTVSEPQIPKAYDPDYTYGYAKIIDKGYTINLHGRTLPNP